VWQALKRATACLRSRDVAIARSILPPPAYALFRRMSAADQEHALCVYSLVRECPLALQQAALMHDVAKGLAGVRLLDRAIYVMLRRAPLHLERWLTQRGRWERLDSLRDHAARGAALCAGAGLGEDVCELVAHHDGSLSEAGLSAGQRALLAALRAADEAC